MTQHDLRSASRWAENGCDLWSPPEQQRALHGRNHGVRATSHGNRKAEKGCIWFSNSGYSASRQLISAFCRSTRVSRSCFGSARLGRIRASIVVPRSAVKWLRVAICVAALFGVDYVGWWRGPSHRGMGRKCAKVYGMLCRGFTPQTSASLPPLQVDLRLWC